MVFNTGAALLDAIVLAVVSREPEGAYGYRITQKVRQAVELRSCGGFRRMAAWRLMTWNTEEETGGTTR